MKEKDIYKISTRNFMKFQIFEFIFILFEKNQMFRKNNFSGNRKKNSR